VTIFVANAASKCHGATWHKNQGSKQEPHTGWLLLYYCLI